MTEANGKGMKENRADLLAEIKAALGADAPDDAVLRKILRAQDQVEQSGPEIGTIKVHSENGKVAVRCFKRGVPCWGVVNRNGGYAYHRDPVLPEVWVTVFTPPEPEPEPIEGTEADGHDAGAPENQVS